MAPTSAGDPESNSLELLRGSPGGTPPGRVNRLRKGVALGAVGVGIATLGASELLFPGTPLATVVAPIFAGFFVVMGVAAWFLVGWATHRTPTSLSLTETGLTAVLRDGTSVTGRWADPEFALEVSSFRRAGSSEEVYSLAWTAPAGPLPATITAAGFEALQSEASANGFEVATSTHGEDLRAFTSHVIRRPGPLEPVRDARPSESAARSSGL